MTITDDCRRRKRLNGALYRNLLQNREILIKICEDTLAYPSGESGGYLSISEKNYIADKDNIDWAEQGDIDKNNIKTLNVWLPNATFYLRFKDGELRSGDFFNFRAMVKHCSREVAIAQIQELYNKLQGQEAIKAQAAKNKRTHQENLRDRDLVYNVLFPENSTKPWYGTEGQLRKALECSEGPSLNWILRRWEDSKDQHRFQVTSRVWRNKKGNVRLRRFTLTPTGIDSRLEEAKVEASKALGISEKDRERMVNRLYEQASEAEDKLMHQ